MDEMMSESQLKNLLTNHVMRVKFQKVSTGEEREMICSSHESLVQSKTKSGTISGGGTGKSRKPGLITTYDLEKDNWRAFYFEKLIEAEILNTKLEDWSDVNVSTQA